MCTVVYRLQISLHIYQVLIDIYGLHTITSYLSTIFVNIQYTYYLDRENCEKHILQYHVQQKLYSKEFDH